MLQDMKETESAIVKKKEAYSIQREQKLQKKNLFANLDLMLKLQAEVIVFLDTNQKTEFLASEVC